MNVEQATLTLLPDVLDLVLDGRDKEAAAEMDRIGGLTGYKLSWQVQGRRSVTIHSPIPLRGVLRFSELFPFTRDHAPPLQAQAFQDAYRAFQEVYDARQELIYPGTMRHLSLEHRRGALDGLTDLIITRHAALKAAHARALSSAPTTGSGQAVLF